MDKMTQRVEKDEYYLNIARAVARRGTCLRRNFGAIIVKNDRIVSSGYTGPPRGREHCKVCQRIELNVPSGERYELCRSVHAEMNAVINASVEEMRGATLYLAGIERRSGVDMDCGRPPCALCERIIINACVKKVVVLTGSGDIDEYLVDDMTGEF